tara:strand:+ start:111 stop:512 length:402 start_codon:yes stop_codon:yes gene_type:complete
MWYKFWQINSGGGYVGPHYVIVEADSTDGANDLAVNSESIYFDGVELGRDCSCCGDRWERVYDGEGEDNWKDLVDGMALFSPHGESTLGIRIITENDETQSAIARRIQERVREEGCNVIQSEREWNRLTGKRN